MAAFGKEVTPVHGRFRASGIRPVLHTGSPSAERAVNGPANVELKLPVVIARSHTTEIVTRLCFCLCWLQSLYVPQRRIEPRLVDQYTEIARLAGGLAHEIKNPLSTIRMNMELLAEDFRDSDDARDRRAMKKVELVEQECRRLQDLLDNFLRSRRPTG